MIRMSRRMRRMMRMIKVKRRTRLHYLLPLEVDEENDNVRGKVRQPNFLPLEEG